MVDVALTYGGIIGVLISGAFVYLEVGRYATPQVPSSLFDERKEFYAYTAGLFVGVPLAFPWLLLLTAAANGANVAALVDIVLLVAGGEIAQWYLLRSRYFGSDAAGAFYSLGLRAGISGILILALVASYFNGSSFTAFGIATVIVAAFAVLAIEVAAAILSLSRSAQRPQARGSPVSGGLVGALGFALIAIGWAFGGWLGLAAIAAALVGAGGVYYRVRRRILEQIPAPALPRGTEDKTPFGRTDR
ncbi:MAG: hypothetical protein WCA77_04930 [Thermoplasmata archaeon]